MSARLVTRRDPKAGAVRKYWMIDINYEHPDGHIERVRKVSPVQTKRGAEEYERRIRAELLNPTPKKQEEVPMFEQFVDERWLPVYPRRSREPVLDDRREGEPPAPAPESRVRKAAPGRDR